MFQWIALVITISLRPLKMTSEAIVDTFSMAFIAFQSTVAHHVTHHVAHHVTHGRTDAMIEHIESNDCFQRSITSLSQAASVSVRDVTAQLTWFRMSGIVMDASACVAAVLSLVLYNFR